MQFGERRLTPIQSGFQLSGVHGWPSLRDAQKRAVRACCSAGLQLVWGPPGTGKTFVIAVAISHLVASGQRVLLVSNNNIAVDTALSEALRILGTDRDGQAIRVGNIGLPALAADRRVRLDQLVEARQAEQRARLDDLATQLEDLERASVQLAESEQRLVGFDPDAYRLATARTDNRQRYDKVTEALGPGEVRLERARAESRMHELRLVSLACCEAADREAEIRESLAAVEPHRSITPSWA